jgi:hypothetical protein
VRSTEFFTEGRGKATEIRIERINITVPKEDDGGK